MSTIRQAVTYMLNVAERDRSPEVSGLYLTLRILDAVEQQGPKKARERLS